MILFFEAMCISNQIQGLIKAIQGSAVNTGFIFQEIRVQGLERTIVKDI